KESSLVGKSLEESRLAEAFGLTVLGIERQGETHMVPDPKEELRADDLLLVKGKEESLTAIRGLQDLSVEPEPAPKLERLESAEVGLVEAVLSPHTTLAGKTLRQLHFREKYDLSVLAIWSGGRAFRTDLRELRLRFGDALLLYGRREKLRLLGTDPDFLVLTEEIQEAPRVEKAPIAALVMAGVVLTVLLGWLPIAVAAVIGAALMVLTGCLSMDEAYRFIDWRAVFLIAGMLPLGIAMQNSGAARFLAEGVVSMVGGFGPLALVAGMFLLTALASQVMPNPVVTVLMAPIAISTAYNLDMSPFALMMVVALAASASFLSPVGHPANVLIMGPGGYRFGDYIKVGLPLTLVVLVIALTVLPLVWPLF
ncbi:MAG: SLC13 family permease, partial [Anaerolineales bacterium]